MSCQMNVHEGAAHAWIGYGKSLLYTGLSEVTYTVALRCISKEALAGHLLQSINALPTAIRWSGAGLLFSLAVGDGVHNFCVKSGKQPFIKKASSIAGIVLGTAVIQAFPMASFVRGASLLSSAFLIRQELS